MIEGIAKREPKKDVCHYCSRSFVSKTVSSQRSKTTRKEEIG
jgi:hypothetical protein